MPNESLQQLAARDYEFGFTTDIEMDIVEPGLNPDVIRFISAKKGEPEWMTDVAARSRSSAGRRWSSPTTGRTSRTRRSTTRRSATTRRRRSR